MPHRSAPRAFLEPDVLNGLLVSSAALADSASPDLTPGVPVTFSNGTQRATLVSPAAKAALAVLMDRWPCAIEVEELCALALDRASGFASGDVGGMRQSLMEDLFSGVMYGLIELHTVAPRCTNHPSDTPCACPVAALQAQAGHVVVNAHHRMVELDALSAQVLKLADGHRHRTDILSTLVQWFEHGRMTLEEDGRPVTDLHTARAMLAEREEKAIASLTRSALLVG